MENIISKDVFLKQNLNVDMFHYVVPPEETSELSVGVIVLYLSVGVIAAIGVGVAFFFIFYTLLIYRCGNMRNVEYAVVVSKILVLFAF